MTETLLIEDNCEEEKEKNGDNDNNKRKLELEEIFKTSYDSEQNWKIEHNLKANQNYNKSIKICFHKRKPSILISDSLLMGCLVFIF
jgi:hypothetical protein